VHLDDTSAPDYGEFLHTGPRKWTDFGAPSRRAILRHCYCNH
jgi:hypothetical protein